MQKTDISYFAGLVDGEGSIGIDKSGQKRGGYRSFFQIAITDEGIYEKSKELNK